MFTLRSRFFEKNSENAFSRKRIEKVMGPSESAPKPLSNEWSCRCQYVLTILNVLGNFCFLPLVTEVAIKKMVPAMEGDIPKCHPEDNVSKVWHFGVSPDMEGTIFYIVSKAPRATCLIHPYARHDFWSWFGQKIAQMNCAPFSTHHDVT
jgi:hypothetical protein